MGAVLGGKAALRCLRQGSAHRRDAQQGFVLCHIGTDQEVSGGATEYRAEMLPASGIVWSINGERPPRPIALNPVQVASVPRIAGIAAQWLQPLPVETENEPLISTNQRALSSSEIGEIRQLQRRLIWNGWFFLYAFDLFFIPHLWRFFSSVSQSTNVDTSEVQYNAFLAVGLLCLHWRPFRQLWVACHIVDDIKHGSVIILSYSPELSGDRGEEPETTTPVICEVLPWSEILWTVDGVPAPWRTVPEG